jgi:hypothetical protein
MPTERNSTYKVSCGEIYIHLDSTFESSSQHGAIISVIDNISVDNDRHSR